ncbi:hypothetical protein A3J13_01645 [Candidatus Daviesbacteria bacterium RIFCSPLOWO2_02_FULL_36_8]|uniref:Uncharacterized protein n=1 Tax=Candidatus Daviesbacteria bacterium RIFCSPLOWO2_02_FULL_36_8 TaxID=1797793 RepID=A0A1F5MH14_9BACT|nr:MAG: hypothetical protein A3J13_01645 [Candidatus Daviesbacteria bacterium RIFCSPLOWO2_02_FULL_36_8]
MSELKDFISNKKNLISLLLLGIVGLALPLIINLVQKQQIFKSRADIAPITFTGENVSSLPNGTKIFRLDAKGKPAVDIDLISPIGASSVGIGTTI